MKLIVVHGDHRIKSYERLKVFMDEAKNRKWVIVRLGSDEKLSITEQLLSPSLFSETRLFLLEDITKLNNKDLKWVRDNHKNIDSTLIIYHRNTLNKTLLNKIPKPEKIEEYKLPKIIWSFLESFYPGNSRNCIKLLHQVVENDPVEFVFALLARQLKDLYLANLYTNNHEISSKPNPFPSWRFSKLKSQAKKFPDGKIQKIISDLADIDVKAKTSQANLIDSLDFLIAKKLE